MRAAFFRLVYPRGDARVVPAFRSQDALHQLGVFGQSGRDLCGVRRLAVTVTQRGQFLEQIAQARLGLAVGFGQAVDLQCVRNRGFLVRVFGFGELDRFHLELVDRGQGLAQFGIAHRGIADLLDRLSVRQRRLAQWRGLPFGGLGAGLFLGNPALELGHRFQRLVQFGVVLDVQLGDCGVEFRVGNDRIDCRQTGIGGRGGDGHFAGL